MKWNLDFEWKTFDTLYALDSFASYWSENEALIQKAADEEEAKFGPKWTPNDEEELAEYHMERDTARHLHDEIMTPHVSLFVHRDALHDHRARASKAPRKH